MICEIKITEKFKISLLNKFYIRKNQLNYGSTGSNLAGMDGFEPSKCQSQSLVPYRLATSQYLVCVSIVSQKNAIVNNFLKIMKFFLDLAYDSKIPARIVDKNRKK